MVKQLLFLKTTTTDSGTGAPTVSSSDIEKIINQKLEQPLKLIADTQVEIKEIKKLTRGSGNTVQIMEGPSKAEIDSINQQLAVFKLQIDSLRNLFAKSQKDVEKELQYKVDINVLADMEKNLSEKNVDTNVLMNKKMEDLRKLRGQVIKIEASQRK